MTNIESILPCPFCGSDTTPRLENTHTASFWVKCESEQGGCNAQAHGEYFKGPKRQTRFHFDPEASANDRFSAKSLDQLHPEYRRAAESAIAAWNRRTTPPPREVGEGFVVASPNGQGCVKPDTATHVYFYEQDFYVLSNFSAFSLNFDGYRFATSEAAYQFQKFVNYWDLNDAAGDDAQEIARQIIKARSAHEAFKIAEHHKDLRRPDWDEIKLDVMRRILREKVDQHEYVRRKLLATGDRILVEDSWRDDFWGWGPNRDGQNWLGRLWMEVRDELLTAAPGGKAGA